ncbi:hypothetical protein [Phaeacidiphilus oryzae]|jgi:hypothetical protein|uniref:hypothetical protein n=1 Tax=Phaeacidiphilus oryzae TaxID=348818 RepID=UPI0005615033|nr:hypothetical protein [Phaeacidiphilus oryzae]
MRTTKRGIVTAFAIAATLSLATGPQAMAAAPPVAHHQGPQGRCVEGHRTFFLEKNGPDVWPVLGGRYTAGNVGVDFAGCVDQPPTAWTATITNQDTSGWAGFDQYEIEGILNTPIPAGPNAKFFRLRLIVKQCVPLVHWIFNKTCAQADEIDVDITFSENAVYHWMTDYIDVSAEQPASWYKTEQFGSSRPYFSEYDTP